MEYSPLVFFNIEGSNNKKDVKLLAFTKERYARLSLCKFLCFDNNQWNEKYNNHYKLELPFEYSLEEFGCDFIVCFVFSFFFCFDFYFFLLFCDIAE